jgi:signal transduction histidine kinase/CheY-like chemotaxis protein
MTSQKKISPIHAESHGRPNLLAVLGRGVNAARLMCALSAFAFFSFAWVDPFLVEGSLTEIYGFRAFVVVMDILAFALTWSAWGKRHFIAIGTVVGVGTGIGVVILTEMTGGPSSPYWTMLVLTFFGITLILPQKPHHAALSLGFLALFYIFWMKTMAPEAETKHWAVSIAGILLSWVVSVAATAYLGEYRRRETEIRDELLQLNDRLITEIEERERAEALVQRTQQLDAVGRLGAGLAHELNNLLAVISGSAETILHNPARTPVSAERILKSAQMGAKLTNDLLVFARKSGRESAPILINTVISDVTDMLLRTYPRRLDIQISGLDDPIWIEGDAQLLSQAMLNLCLNGVHSMNEKGGLDIEVKRQETSTVIVTIRDSGCGMSPEVMKQAIEPFFTTRPPGKGSGLGLSMAYGTVRDHHGKLSLDSKEGEGTTVTLEFPTLPHEMQPQPLTTANTETTKSPESRLHLPEGLTVLLVDDDEGVRQVIEDLLLSQGCQVISRASGDEAIAYVDSDSPPVDLIVLDRMMPGLSGEETFIKLRDMGPSIPTLLYSGLFMDADSHLLREHEHVAFVQKPFSQETLFSCMTKLLDKPS